MERSSISLEFLRGHRDSMVCDTSVAVTSFRIFDINRHRVSMSPVYTHEETVEG